MDDIHDWVMVALTIIIVFGGMVSNSTIYLYHSVHKYLSSYDDKGRYSATIQMLSVSALMGISILLTWVWLMAGNDEIYVVYLLNVFILLILHTGNHFKRPTLRVHINTAALIAVSVIFITI